MNITNLRATRIGSHAHQYLSERSRIGTVISAFRHGFNVQFSGDSDPGFVSIQTEEVLMHPWSIELVEPIRAPEAGVPCFSEASLLRFDSESCVDIVTAKVCELRITPWTQEEAARVQDRIPLIEEFLSTECSKQVPDPFQPQINAILEYWRQSDSADDLLGLVGLGAGSTPSGDDILVGMLAACSALETTTLARALRTADIRRCTHPASAQMIEAAIDGAFSQSLRDLADQLGQATSTEALLRQRIETLADQGATSGSAMLVGFATAYGWQSQA